MSETGINEILNILGNPVSSVFYLEKMNSFCSNDTDISKAIIRTTRFLSHFSKYLKKPEFQEQIFRIISKTYEICEKFDDLPELLLKTSALHFIELYINYSDLSANVKESMLNVLGSSFGDLLPGPQILNLCVLVEPIFKNESYKRKKNRIEEFEVVYKPILEAPKVEHEIKSEVDRWINSQEINLEKQQELIEGVKFGVKNLAEMKSLAINDETYGELEKQCVEMLIMKFTSKALLAEFDDDEDLMPVPLN